jgi:hypothetical protein
MSLASWEAYLKDLEGHPGYSTIISDNPKEAATKAKALQYLLSTLPTRHAELVRSCSDPEVETVKLADMCGNLLDELQSPSHEIDLNAWFNMVSTGKRFIDRVLSIEKDIEEEEQRRLQELSRLKAVHMSLMQVCGDGELGMKDVEVLMDAMEAVGVLLVGSGGFEPPEEVHWLEGGAEALSNGGTQAVALK